MFKTILVATDRVTGVDAPVSTAIDFARQHQAELHILHVLEPVSTDSRDRIMHFRTGHEILITPDYLERVGDELKQNYHSILTEFEKGSIRISTGCPWEEIVRTARKINTDLILMGPHAGNAGERGVIRVAGKIGSTVQNVIARENCPVMIISRPVNRETLLLKKIVVGIDFSVSSECALCLGAKMSRHFGSTLYPFFMLPVPPYPKYSGAGYQSDMDTFRHKLKDFCDLYLDGTDHEYQLWGGALPHLEVLKCAEKMDADLIMLGSHTKLSSGKWYGGSVVEQVSHRAECPVVSVNDPEALIRWKDILVPSSDGEIPVDRTIHLFNTPQG